MQDESAQLAVTVWKHTRMGAREIPLSTRAFPAESSGSIAAS